MLATRTEGRKTQHWEILLKDALHSVRSLLCIATNCTPQERMFTYQRKSFDGIALPSWLTTPGTVLMKKHVRQSEYNPLVGEVQLLETNPQYALVRHDDGRKTTFSLKHLAP
ncbi:hypothetical protein JTB14_016999 [Gonioctena quinquepunctata]|nr:hypothetical protein JTB14_016999 [Gonioctena quinquepunctata]